MTPSLQNAGVYVGAAFSRDARLAGIKDFLIFVWQSICFRQLMRLLRLILSLAMTLRHGMIRGDPENFLIQSPPVRRQNPKARPHLHGDRCRAGMTPKYPAPSINQIMEASNLSASGESMQYLVERSVSFQRKCLPLRFSGSCRNWIAFPCCIFCHSGHDPESSAFSTGHNFWMPDPSSRT